MADRVVLTCHSQANKNSHMKSRVTKGMFIMRHGIAVHGMGTEKYTRLCPFAGILAGVDPGVGLLHHGTRTGDLHTGSTRSEPPEEEVIGIASDSVVPAHVALALPRFHTSIDVARSAVPTGYGTVMASVGSDQTAGSAFMARRTEWISPDQQTVLPQGELSGLRQGHVYAIPLSRSDTVEHNYS
ncbi:unnamed protein product [Calypogeia fissa]